MVAYTSPDCLPYLDGSDAPCLNTGTVCDPSTVWCDFAELVEAKLTGYDALVQRTAESVPMAWVETIEPVTHTVGDPDPLPVFTTVRNDTDDMVSLDTISSGFRINTPGLYVLWTYAYGVNGAANAGTARQRLTTRISPVASPATITSFDADSGSLAAGLIIAAHMHLVTPIGATQLVLTSISLTGTTSDTATFTKIAMGATWVGDLP